MAAIYVDFGIESIRAVESLELAARAAAGCSGRSEVQIEDLLAVVPAVFGHRTDAANIVNILRYLEAKTGGVAEQGRNGAHAACAVAEKFVPPSLEKAPRTSPLRTAWEKLRALSQFSGAASPPGSSKAPAGGKEGGTPEHGPAEAAQVSQAVAPPDKAVPLKDLPLNRYVQCDDHKLL